MFDHPKILGFLKNGVIIESLMNIRAKARELGIPPTTLEYRIKAGWDESLWGKKKPNIDKGYKRCSVCRIVKAEFLFYKRKTRNGYLSRCKQCAKNKG